MTQQVPSPTMIQATPAAPEPKPRPDKLVPMLNELRRDIKRILSQAPSVEQLQQELARTIMDQMVDLVTEVLEFRNWAAVAHSEHAAHLNEHEERLGMVEAISLGADSQLTPDDAALFAKCAEAAEVLATEAMKATTDPSGRAHLQSVLDVAAEAKTRISDLEMDDEEDEEDDDGDDDGDGEDQLPAPVVAALPQPAPSAPGN
jgi:hypothetical protein